MKGEYKDGQMQEAFTSAIHTAFDRLTKSGWKNHKMNVEAHPAFIEHVFKEPNLDEPTIVEVVNTAFVYIHASRRVEPHVIRVEMPAGRKDVHVYVEVWVFKPGDVEGFADAPKPQEKPQVSIAVPDPKDANEAVQNAYIMAVQALKPHVVEILKDINSGVPRPGSPNAVIQIALMYKAWGGIVQTAVRMCHPERAHEVLAVVNDYISRMATEQAEQDDDEDEREPEQEE